MYAIKASLLPPFVLRHVRIFFCFRSLKSRILLFVLILNIVFLYTLYNKGSSSSNSHKSEHKERTKRLHTGTVAQQDVDIDTLDAVNIRKMLKPTNFNEASHCEKLKDRRPKVDLVEPKRWQMVVDGIPETFVFSAYFDSRY